MSKTLLLLGGSAAQLEAIDKAQKLGYRTVLCDYLPDNPGQQHADSFHLVSTTDRDAVLEVALAESVDGIVAYGSDPAAPTAAYVAQKLGLPGNPLQSVESFCDKARFRTLLKNGGFPCPGFFAVAAGADAGEIASAAEGLSAPFVVKPVDSSGSKGVSVVNGREGLARAVDAALLHSRSKVAIVEEIVHPGRYGVVEAEVFVVKGIVRSWVLMQSVRGREVNPLVPTLSIHRPHLPDIIERHVRCEIQRLVDAAGILNGPMNIEMMVGDKGEVCFIDVGPRNGGNMLARFASVVSGKDVVGATVRAAMGDIDAASVEYDGHPNCRWVQHILGSAKPGILCGLRKDYLESENLAELHLFNRIGDEIPSFDDASGAVGVAFLRFPEDCSDEDVASFVEEPCVVGLKKRG